MTQARANELRRDLKPYMYGRTPLGFALKRTVEIFGYQTPRKADSTKLLFVLSDGLPTDKNPPNPDEVRAEMEKEAVQIFGCYVSQNIQTHSMRIFSSVQKNWDQGAQFLFNLSSFVRTKGNKENVIKAIFEKRGWQIDIGNDHSKLFCCVSDPDNLKDVCEFAKNIVCAKDSLCDILCYANLSIYMGQQVPDFDPKDQGQTLTCFAYAIATVVHLALKRLNGNESLGKDMDQFEKIRDEILQLAQQVSPQGPVSTVHVLQHILRQQEYFPLTYRTVLSGNETETIRESLAGTRPLLARFELTESEWKLFREFFDTRPSGILTREDLDISQRDRTAKTIGHAVVLTSVTTEYSYFINSWGSKWADNGCFKVANTRVLNCQLFEVFWDLDKLDFSKRADYDLLSQTIAKKLMENLSGLHKAKFKCPKCRIPSLVTEFTGVLSDVVCPRGCHFEAEAEQGNMLVLNLFLTSLSNF